MFYFTFVGCTGLTSLPSGLFASFTTSAEYMFYETFYNCTGLTSLPNGLFASFTTGAEDMFRNTFEGCTGLTSLPEGMFANLTTGATYMFSYTFFGCSNLSGYIPPSMFAGLIANGSPNYSNFMNNMFNETGLATSCTGYPGTTQYITGYESYWYSRVSCITANAMKTVSYSCGDGTGTAPIDSNEYISGVYVTTMLNTCTPPTGKGFKNWLCGETSVNAGDKFTITENTTCIAQYDNSVNVTYSCGDGSGTAPVDSNIYGMGATVTILANTCTSPTGKGFKNWLCGETNMSSGGKFTITENTTCTAQYDDAVNVTYSCGDGSGNAPIDSNAYMSGATVTTLANYHIVQYMLYFRLL